MNHRRLVAAQGLACVFVCMVTSCSSDEGATTPPGHGYNSDGGGEAGSDVSTDGLISTDQQSDKEEGCPGGCPENQICSHGTCVLQTTCTTADDCENDTYCVPGTGCVPWGWAPGPLRGSSSRR